MARRIETEQFATQSPSGRLRPVPSLASTIEAYEALCHQSMGAQYNLHYGFDSLYNSALAKARVSSIDRQLAAGTTMTEDL